LVKARGVKKADVSFEKKQAKVTYDPGVIKPAELAKVVASARSPMGPSTKFQARVHQGK
jgi:copper chaperone CopZ